ncbi:MAG: S9 family peptidase, partial [Gemmatimonadetes bacterium]|nr:S9 family peptidase [Gemmatimonadota bacterium]
NDRGSRNVWIARGPEWQARQITGWSGDDGQELSGLELAPDGRYVVVQRGGAPNRSGWTPAPAQDVDGAERATLRIDLDGGEPADIEWGTLSPDGTRLARVRDGRIEVGPVPAAQTGEAEEAADFEPIARPRSGAGQLTWAPDGRHIAFVSSRGEHAFVGVAAADGSGFRWLDPGVTRDGSPVWSPDGTRIAFRRQWADPGPTLPFFARREADIPWGLVVVEIASGEADEVFRADPGAGSRFSGWTGPSLVWTADDHLVFPWEKDGWRRAWAVPAAGGEPRLLTPGEHEIQHFRVGPDGRRLVFDSNRDDIDRKHIWATTATDPSPTLLTPGEGVEWAPVVTASGQVAFLGSGARTAARPWVLGNSGDRIAPQGELPASFPEDELVVPEAVVFPATDGMEIHGQLFLPSDLRPGERRPALLFFHGGSRRQMLLGFHNRGYYHNAYAFNQYMANRGYVVLAVNYRSGVGYGLDFREADDYGADGASEVRDVIGSALYLRGRADVDPDRIGLWGGSYGGYLTAQGLVHAPELFAAGVDVHGVHDWNVGIGNFRPDYEPENHPDLAQRAFESSPLSLVDRWEDPVLLIHGDDDRNVRFAETVTLARELTLRGVPHDLLVFPDEVHGFLLHRNWLAAFGAAEAHFDRWLRDRRPAMD